MMEDWTDIIGEELEMVEIPLPADDWSVLQQKYATSRNRRRAAAFALAFGFTSVAAVIAMVLLLFHPETSSDIIPESADNIDVLVAETLLPTDQTIISDTIAAESSAEIIIHEDTRVKIQESSPAAVNTAVSDVLISENDIKEATPEPYKTDELIAEASAGYLRFEDIPDESTQRRRRPVSFGISGAVSDSPIIGMKMDYGEPPMYDAEVSPPVLTNPSDTIETDVLQPAKSMLRASSGHTDSYQHEIPISFGVSARIFLTDRLSINTGLNYTRYKSLRSRVYIGTYDLQKDWQYVHYLGIPVRLDYMAVNRKHFNLYFGVGMQVDKCIYARVGDERLHEKQLLFGVNGATGLQVNIVPMVGLYIEPEVSYALNKGTIETFRYDEPFVITVRCGLRFNF